ncbi:MAG: MBL fold metallo-hydrolase [Allomuricauda sp.]
MTLKCISTGSHGNCYLFIDSIGKILIVEAGVKIRKIKEAINFILSNVVGCITTHEHTDHFSGCRDLMRIGIDVYATRETHESKNTQNQHRAKFIQPLSTFSLGPFNILAFPVEHDAANPVGFIIQHKECGRTIFLTDSYYVKYRFKKIDNILLEVNYSDEIIQHNIENERSSNFLRERILKSHMELSTAIDFLAANDLSNVRQIFLIHLSSTNSSIPHFEKKIRQATGKPTTALLDNSVVNISTNPF